MFTQTEFLKKGYFLKFKYIFSHFLKIEKYIGSNRVSLFKYMAADPKCN